MESYAGPALGPQKCKKRLFSLLFWLFAPPQDQSGRNFIREGFWEGFRDFRLDGPMDPLKALREGFQPPFGTFGGAIWCFWGLSVSLASIGCVGSALEGY